MRTHQNQTTPISNAEMPLVCTGAEFIVPQLASPRFVQKAKKMESSLKLIKIKH